MKTNLKHEAGQTLAGLMLTLAITALIATLALPAWGNLVARTRLQTESNAFLHGIHMARRESVKRNDYVSLCKSSNGESCDSKASWSDGWMIFIDSAERWPPVRRPEDEIIYIRKPNKGIEIKANRVAFSIRTLRKRTTNGTVIFCDRKGQADALGLVVSYTGRPRQKPLAELSSRLSCARNNH